MLKKIGFYLRYTLAAHSFHTEKYLNFNILYILKYIILMLLQSKPKIIKLGSAIPENIPFEIAVNF